MAAYLQSTKVAAMRCMPRDKKYSTRWAAHGTHLGKAHGTHLGKADGTHLGKADLAVVLAVRVASPEMLGHTTPSACRPCTSRRHVHV